MNIVKFRKSGLFYDAFDDDAKIMHYLFGYRIIDGRASFPSNALNKVLNTLIDNCISYEIFLDNELVKEDFKDKNNYMKFLVKASNKLEVAKVMNQIIQKLDTFSEEQLYDVLNKLSEIVNEK